MEGIGPVDYWLTQPMVYLRYLKLLILPSDLVLDYGWIPSDFGSWLWLGALGWGLLVAFSIQQFPRVGGLCLGEWRQQWFCKSSIFTTE